MTRLRQGSGLPVEASAKTGGQGHCPHPNVIHCPLYIAAHDGRISHLGCEDGVPDPFGCGVDHGMDYAEAIEKLRAADPRLVAICRFKEEAAAARMQRLRNMRLLGVH